MDPYPGPRQLAFAGFAPVSRGLPAAAPAPAVSPQHPAGPSCRTRFQDRARTQSPAARSPIPEPRRLEGQAIKRSRFFSGSPVGGASFKRVARDALASSSPVPAPSASAPASEPDADDGIAAYERELRGATERLLATLELVSGMSREVDAIMERYRERHEACKSAAEEFRLPSGLADDAGFDASVRLLMNDAEFSRAMEVYANVAIARLDAAAAALPALEEDPEDEATLAEMRVALLNEIPLGPEPAAWPEFVRLNPGLWAPPALGLQRMKQGALLEFVLAQKPALLQKLEAVAPKSPAAGDALALQRRPMAADARDEGVPEFLAGLLQPATLKFWSRE
eukprot:tig00021531_g22165.t1